MAVGSPWSSWLLEYGGSDVKFGCAIGGAVIGFLAWWVLGFAVGVSNDYVLYRKYEPVAYPALFVMVVLGFILGLVSGIISRRKDR
jgi:hypothetical protein